MKVTFISPYVNIYSVGTRILSSALKRDGHDVRIIFLPGNSLEKYSDNVLNEVIELSRGSGLIGVSLMTDNFNNAVQITQALKRDLKIPVLWGGVHPTVRPEECLGYADMICIGEGEEVIVELAKKMESGRDHHDIKGIWANGKSGIVKNELRPLLQDLDATYFLDYDHDTHYIYDDGHIRKMTKELLLKHSAGTYMTMPTRGCPFGCSYCFNNKLNSMHPGQNPVRKRSIDNIIKELMQVKLKMPFMGHIYFDDDAFFLYTADEIRRFSEEYKKNIDLPLTVTGATPSTLTREKLSLLVDAGLTFTRMGIQTGSERTKRLYKRRHSNEQVLKAAAIINEFRKNIRAPQYDIIIDNPWETDEDLIETLIFLTKFPLPYHVGICSLTFYPGTELYEKAKTENIIGEDLDFIYLKGFYRHKQTYLNRLFLLMDMNTEHKISTRLMSLLTSRALRRTGLNWVLYYLVVNLRFKWPVWTSMKKTCAKGGKLP